jgi:hypothetical protein
MSAVHPLLNPLPQGEDFICAFVRKRLKRILLIYSLASLTPTPPISGRLSPGGRDENIVQLYCIKFKKIIHHCVFGSPIHPPPLKCMIKRG